MCYETRAQVHRNCILGVQHVSPVQGDIGELCRRSVTKPTAGWTVGARRAFPQVEPVPKSRVDTSRTGRYCTDLRGVVCPNLQPDAVGGFLYPFRPQLRPRTAFVRGLSHFRRSKCRQAR
jgi:hypothetical protein